MTHTRLNGLKKIGYSLLMVWVCGLSPLIYVGAYSPHRGVQPYPITIFQQSSRINELYQALTEISERQQAEQRLARYLFTGVNFYHPVATVATVALSTLYQGFIWAAAYIIPFWNIFSLSGWVVLLVLLRSSVWLPPPEKPPPFL